MSRLDGSIDDASDEAFAIDGSRSRTARVDEVDRIELAGRCHHCGSKEENHRVQQPGQGGAGGGPARRTLSVSEPVTTLVLDMAIAPAAIIGCRWKPHGKKKPIASGIIRML